MYRNFLKRQIDLFVSILMLVLVSPLLLVIILLTYFRIGPPIIFRQERPGQGSLPFEILKFRTMLNKRDQANLLLPDSQRLTDIGRFLRSTSLDEFPELINVIKGDMSLVGPRPLLMKYLGRYTKEQMRRHEVRPGITGWAQVNGRNAITWEQKFELDVWYVDNYSFWLDIKIIFLTFWKSLTREGINQPGQATAEEFLGSSTINEITE